MSVDGLCYLGALVCFLLAAFGAGKVGWRDMGYAFLVLSLLIS